MTDVMLALKGIHKRFGSRVSAQDLNLDIANGEFFTLLGPSGSGKSTVLRMVAGLETPDSGQIIMRGRDITAVPPWHRQIGMVFQHYANFPHLNVQQNIAYGLRRSGMGKDAIRARVSELLALVGMQGFESRRVTQLSGGEQQRIAIARALAPKPDVLLLDEPLSALDEKIRREMQQELRDIQQGTGTTFIYVTHDQEEALTMSDRIAVLNGGLCVQCDAPEQIFQRPRTPFVARFFRGSNVLRAEVRPAENGQLEVAFGGTGWLLPESQIPSGQVSHIAIRSEALALEGAAQACEGQLDATVKAISYRGIYTACELELKDGQSLSVATLSQLPLQPGDMTRVGLNAADIVLLEQD